MYTNIKVDDGTIQEGDIVLLSNGQSVRLIPCKRNGENTSLERLEKIKEPWPWWSEDRKIFFRKDLSEVRCLSDYGRSILAPYTVKSHTRPPLPEGQAAKLYDAFRSGFVNRYHSHDSPLLRNAQDLTDAHSNRMVKLLFALFDIHKPILDVDFNKIIYEIVVHDAGEKKSGDSPHVAKIESPALKKELDIIEGSFVSAVFPLRPNLNKKERLIVKTLDVLESVLFQFMHNPSGAGATDDSEKFSIKNAEVLGIKRKVVGLISYAKKVNKVD